MRFSIPIIGLILASSVFAADLAFGLGAISVLYFIFLFFVFWFSKDIYYILSATISSIILIFTGWSLSERFSETLIDIGIIKAQLDYEGLFRVFALTIIILIGGMLAFQKQKEKELKELNETLGLRILSRTVSSENKVKKLEQQILILQKIRKQDIEYSLANLDAVIQELKELNDSETL